MCSQGLLGIKDKGMVQGEVVLLKFMRLTVSAAVLLLSMPSLAWGTGVPAEISVGNRSIPDLEWLPVLDPELPPLGEYSKFIPFEQELYPEQVTEGVRLVIRLSERRVYVYRNDRIQTSYPIAVGKEGWETPTGQYEVMQMQRNPIWEHPWTGELVYPGPDNPLGPRWIGFWTDGKDLIGFHGTPNEELIGEAVSHGCVRMRNQDILSLYAQVELGTPVTVEP
ncbi:L,D-transpeptidase [Laspinema olomoucense]|uniref:L,D-transpeptidase n=1 Tax=Laspinema olomoucense TaxID=3231600 RepID=UPI0021BB1E0E|nr:L,D-transpeptidase [Laspinema sp. D3c]MCT7994161.1 L,D-transpeptidase [Laspinema sp. D3c]